MVHYSGKILDLDFLDLNSLLISKNQTHMGIYFILETRRFQIVTVLHAN